MTEPTKHELVDDAVDVGIAEADDMTKAELEEALEARNPPALGPVIPEGSTEPPAFKSSGRPTVAFRPQKVSEIPKAGR